MASTGDPIQTVEGMYKGSLARLSDFFKSPSTYGAASLLVLKESAKRYDDALDDCVIQIQRAKWLLEHELAQNRARRAREAAAKDAASNKRKADQISAESGTNAPSTQQEDSPIKKAKLQASAITSSPITQKLSPVASKTDKKPQTPTSSKPITQPVPQKEQKPALKPVSKPDSQPLLPAAQPTLLKGLPKKEPDAPLTPKTTPQITQQKDMLGGEQAPSAAEPLRDTAKKIEQAPAPLPSNSQQQKEDKPTTVTKDPWEQERFEPDEVDFESFFPDEGIVNDPMGTGFDLDSVPGPQNPTAPEESSLELLPGLESYANATGDDLNLLNPTVPASGASQSGIPPPQTGGTNAFDDLPGMHEDSNYADLLADTAIGDDSFLDENWQDDDFFKV